MAELASRDQAGEGFPPPRFGWALTSEQNAEAWLAGKAEIAGRDAVSGDCMIINAWQASSNEVNTFVVEQLRQAGRNLRMVYGKRYYGDGRWRPVKLEVKTRAAGHMKNANVSRTGNQAV